MTHPPKLPAAGFVRLTTVLEIIPVSRSTWWAGVKAGKYPASVKLGARATAWKVEDIQKLVNELSADPE